MELTCACILFIVGFVTASPYGYGTKGGALTKAESSAVAGAGGIPAGLGLPSSAGYSGSYSKSSSSSYAAASASSSASSFSYSGSGGLTYPGGNSGAIPSGPGCGSGTCQDAGKGYNPSATIPSGSGCGSGACQDGGKGYNPSAAGSQSYNYNTGYTGTGNAGYGSNYNVNSANGGNYGNSPSDKSDCGTGICQTGKVAPLSIGSNSYSQANSVAGTTGSRYASYPKASSALDSGCSNGNCGVPGPYDDKDKNGSSSKKCTTGYCDTPQTGSNAPYYSNDNKCTSGNCAPNKENDNGSDDIAVTKPNYGSTIHFNDKTSNYGCDNGNCGSSNLKPSYSEPAPIPKPTKCNSPGCNGYGQQPFAYSGASAAAGYNKPSDSGCSNGNCGVPGPYDDKDKNGSGSKKCTTGYCDTPQTGSNAPYYSNDNKCTSGNCAPNRENDNGSDDIAVTKPNYGSTIHFNDKTSNYGCDNGNCGSSNLKPSYSEPAPIPKSTKCNTPGCNGYGQQPSAYSGASAAAGYNKPSSHLTAPKESAPCTTPNCQSYPVSGNPTNNQYIVPNNNTPNPVTSPGGTSQSYNVYTPGTNSPVPATSPEANSPSYIGFPPYSPQQPAPGEPSLPCVGGTCNNQNKAPSFSAPPNYGSQPSIPTGSGCTSPNCGGINPTPSVGPQPNKGIYSQPNYNTPYLQGNTPNNPPTSLASGCSPNSPNCGLGVGPYAEPAAPSVPSYKNPSNSYRPPTTVGQPGYGTTGPHDGGSPAALPSQPSNGYSVASSGQPSNGYYKPGSTAFGSYQPGYTPHNTASSSGSALNTGTYNSPGYGGVTTPTGPSGPANCKTPDCSNPPISNIASAQAGAGNIAKPVDGEKHQDKPTYTGGFGGPAGVLKPNEFDVPSPAAKPVISPVAVPSKPNCVSGNCGSPGAVSSPSYSHGGANAGAAASANAVAYTGGFGGPPGFLKPYDDGKIDLPIGKQISHNGNKDDHYSNSNPGNGSLGSSGGQAHSAAQASAVVGASSGYKSGGCGGGCGGNIGGGSNSGPSGSYGLSKSGYSDGLSGGLNIASASAKSLASADGGSLRGGYAGSSASAHASSGIKSSYGKR